MSLLNIFRPKWQHSDPKIRKAAIRKRLEHLESLSLADIKASLHQIDDIDFKQNIATEVLTNIQLLSFGDIDFLLAEGGTPPTDSVLRLAPSLTNKEREVATAALVKAGAYRKGIPPTTIREYLEEIRESSDAKRCRYWLWLLSRDIYWNHLQLKRDDMIHIRSEATRSIIEAHVEAFDINQNCADIREAKLPFVAAFCSPSYLSSYLSKVSDNHAVILTSSVRSALKYAIALNNAETIAILLNFTARNRDVCLYGWPVDLGHDNDNYDCERCPLSGSFLAAVQIPTQKTPDGYKIARVEFDDGCVLRHTRVFDNSLIDVPRDWKSKRIANLGVFRSLSGF